MAVVRVVKTSNYTVMSNYHLRDMNLSLRTKGLLSQMLSLPPEWDYSVMGLTKINREGKDAIRAALYELENAGYNELMGNRSTVLADCELIRQTLCDTAALATEMQQEQDEMTVVSELMQAHIKKNASVAQSQEAYALEAGRIENRYNAAFEHYTALETEKEKRMRKSKEISTFITTLKKQPMILPEWNERLWITLLDMAIVQRDGSIVFRFKSGKEIIK